MTGTQLAVDGHSCEDIDECRTDNGGCSHSCLNTLGTAFCACPEGYMLADDWKTCDGLFSCFLFCFFIFNSDFLNFGNSPSSRHMIVQLNSIQISTNAITIQTMTRIDCVLECVVIRSDRMFAWIRMKSR